VLSYAEIISDRDTTVSQTGDCALAPA